MFNITQAGIEIFVIAFILAIASNLVTKFTVGKKTQEIKEKTKQLQNELKEAMKKNDIKRAKELQKEMLSISMGSMQFLLKPMLITFIPFILVFVWMTGIYGNIGSVAYEIYTDNKYASLEDPITHNESSILNGTLRSGEEKKFNVVIRLNKNEVNETFANITLNAHSINDDHHYKSIAIAHATTIEELKKPVSEEKNDVDISPKFQSKKSSEGSTYTYSFVVKNYCSDAVITLFGINLSWLFWYIIAMFSVSIITGRILKTY